MTFIYLTLHYIKLCNYEYHDNSNLIILVGDFRVKPKLNMANPHSQTHTVLNANYTKQYKNENAMTV